MLGMWRLIPKPIQKNHLPWMIKFAYIYIYIWPQPKSKICWYKCIICTILGIWKVIWLVIIQSLIMKYGTCFVCKNWFSIKQDTIDVNLVRINKSFMCINFNKVGDYGYYNCMQIKVSVVGNIWWAST